MRLLGESGGLSPPFCIVSASTGRDRRDDSAALVAAAGRVPGVPVRGGRGGDCDVSSSAMAGTQQRKQKRGGRRRETKDRKLVVLFFFLLFLGSPSTTSGAYTTLITIAAGLLFLFMWWAGKPRWQRHATILLCCPDGSTERFERTKLWTTSARTHYVSSYEQITAAKEARGCSVGTTGRRPKQPLCPLLLPLQQQQQPPPRLRGTCAQPGPRDAHRATRGGCHSINEQRGKRNGQTVSRGSW